MLASGGLPDLANSYLEGYRLAEIGRQAERMKSSFRDAGFSDLSASDLPHGVVGKGCEARAILQNTFQPARPDCWMEGLFSPTIRGHVPDSG